MGGIFLIPYLDDDTLAQGVLADMAEMIYEIGSENVLLAFLMLVFILMSTLTVMQTSK